MNNKDFWRSISDIASNGFQPEGLTTLEKYAEWFISGKLVYERFSQTEQYGCINGGAIHVIASLLAGAEIKADSLTAPIGSFKREFECAEAQARRIEQWAKAADCWIDDTEYKLSQLLGEQLAEGGEAHVYDNGTAVVKAIGLDYFIYPELAFDRISLHNAYFPQTSMQVLGYGRDSAGRFLVIVQQPFIHGKRMNDNQIKNYAERLGFKLVNPTNWTYATDRIYLSDMHDENVICSMKGNIFVIDCDIRINTPELKAGGTQHLSHFVRIMNAIQ